MTTHPQDQSDTAGAPSTPADVQTDPAFQDYVHDQLQRSRTVIDHGAMLRNRAKARAAPTPTGAGTVSGTHTVERMLDERAFYPAHDKRAESPDYAKTHHQMTVADDKHCLVCGVQQSTLGDLSNNPFGATQMETHHHVIEWALANAVDPAKFNLHIRPGLLHAAQRRAEAPGYAAANPVYRAFDAAYAQDMDMTTIQNWVDHAADNLWVLCDVHHRHKFVGIHAITYPIWGPQDVLDADVVQQEIGAAKGDPAAV